MTDKCPNCGDAAITVPVVYRQLNKCRREKEELERQLSAAQLLCKIYFDIAAVFIGEDEVRKHRDIAISATEAARRKP